MKVPNGFSVPQLLSAILGLGAVTLGVVGFDAERLIAAEKANETAINSLQVVSATNTQDIASLKPAVGQLQMQYGDLNGRVIKLEPR